MKWRHVKQYNESWFEVNDEKLSKEEFNNMLDWMLKIAVASDKRKIIEIKKKIASY
jgi:hypothetical protein